MKKVGRNDPCPCGSGKKFKKCHLGREEELYSAGAGEFSPEMSARITDLPEVRYGRAPEILETLDLEEIAGRALGIRFVDLKAYHALNLLGSAPPRQERTEGGSVLINPYKTSVTDPHHIYIAISPGITEGALIHQVAHVLDYLAGSRLIPGLTKPLSYELGIPVEQLEHPREFGYWLHYLQERFHPVLDADDTIILYLYENGMLIPGEEIEKRDSLVLKSRSERILKFLSANSAEIDALICEKPGYIGSRVRKD